jgi:hypothetical protein
MHLEKQPGYSGCFPRPPRTAITIDRSPVSVKCLIAKICIKNIETHTESRIWLFEACMNVKNVQNDDEKVLFVQFDPYAASLEWRVPFRMGATGWMSQSGSFPWQCQHQQAGAKQQAGKRDVGRLEGARKVPDQSGEIGTNVTTDIAARVDQAYSTGRRRS